MDRYCAALDGRYNLERSVRNLLISVGDLSPGELVARGGDPDRSLPLRVVAERLDDCLALYDALQRTLGLPADRDPRYQQFLTGGLPADD